MKRATFLVVAVAAIASLIVFKARAFRPAAQADVPVLVTEITAGYVDDAFIKTCFPCHQKIKERDLVFTRYAP